MKKAKDFHTIQKFSEQYQKEFDFYNASSLLAAQLIEAQLATSGIRAIVTSRAKNPTRLKDKINKRHIEENKNYTTLEDIYDDIVDLAGVRIALYFNSEKDEIEQIISEIFNIVKKKEFPTEGKSYGYKATHYRGTMKETVLSEQQQRYSNAKIEIQVASLLMHAWSEVEHDIVYKPLQGKVSSAETEALNELNSIVLQGEEALKKLQLAALKRNGFNNHYDLANYLIQYISDKNSVEEERVVIGDTKRLYDYLYDNKIDTRKKLSNRIKGLEIIIADNWSIADQVMDYILDNNKEKSRSYLDTYAYKDQKSISTESAVGSFLFAWIELEKLLKRHDMGISYKGTFIRLKSLVEFDIISKDAYDKIYEIRNVRNNLVHGIEIPDNNYLAWCENEIHKLMKVLGDKT